MSFTTPCFIRKNNPKLLNKLEELGYHGCSIRPDANLLYCIKDLVLCYYDDKHPERHAYGNGIDCVTNEPLFLAIAGLRDDTDKHQWFKSDVCSDWFKSEIPQACDSWIGEADKDDPFLTEEEKEGWQYFPYHKATVEELINHFKEE